MLRGQTTPLYAFSRALGGGMEGMLAYYLFSPFNVLLLLPLPFPLLYSLLILVKIGLCGLTFWLFLPERDGKGLLFSTTYALCGFMAAYFFLAEWLDALIYLPLVVWGIRRIHAGQSPLLYILSLFAALATQYYLGYMLCGFAALYFLFFLPKRPWKAVRVFTLASLTAAGLAAAVLVPVFLTIRQGYGLAGGMLTLEAGEHPSEYCEQAVHRVRQYGAAAWEHAQPLCGNPDAGARGAVYAQRRDSAGKALAFAGAAPGCWWSAFGLPRPITRGMPLIRRISTPRGFRSCFPS